jgi:hypothetical protein
VPQVGLPLNAKRSSPAGSNTGSHGGEEEHAPMRKALGWMGIIMKSYFFVFSMFSLSFKLKYE